MVDRIWGYSVNVAAVKGLKGVFLHFPFVRYSPLEGREYKVVEGVTEG